MPTLTFDRAAPDKQSNHLWWRIGLLLILVLAFVLTLISFLNYSNYRKNYVELNLTRYLIMGKDLRQTIESGLNIGIAPAENTHLRPTMKELAERQSGTRYIAIVNESGVLVQDGNMPKQTAAYWKDRLSQTAADAYWQTEDANTFQIGMPFSNNFNIKVGAVVIGYDRLGIEAAMNDMLRKLCLNLLQTLLLCACLLLAGCYFLTRNLARDLDIVEEALRPDLNGPVPAPIEEGVLGAQLAQDINAFNTISHGVAQQLRQIELALQSNKPGVTQ